MAMSWANLIITVAMLASGLAVPPAVVHADDVEQDKAIAAIVAAGGKVERIEGGIKVDLSFNFHGDAEAALVHLPALPAVRWLDLRTSQITDVGLARLAGLKELQSLDLMNARITDAGLAHLAGLTKLRSLAFGYVEISDAALVHLAGLTNLRLLDLQGTKVTDAGLDQLAKLKFLDSLYLTGTGVTDAGMARIAEFKLLRSLKPNATEVTNAGIARLAGLTELRSLSSWFRRHRRRIGPLGRVQIPRRVNARRCDRRRDGPPSRVHPAAQVGPHGRSRDRYRNSSTGRAHGTPGAIPWWYRCHRRWVGPPGRAQGTPVPGPPEYPSHRRRAGPIGRVQGTSFSDTRWHRCYRSRDAATQEVIAQGPNRLLLDWGRPLPMQGKQKLGSSPVGVAFLPGYARMTPGPSRLPVVSSDRPSKADPGSLAGWPPRPCP